MSFLQGLVRELGIAQKYVRYHVRESLSQYVSRIRPAPAKDTQFMHNLRVLQSRKEKAKQESQKGMSWKEWLYQSYQRSCSMQSAKMALLDACATAHAAEAAADMGINVESINFAEETANTSAVGENEKKSNVVAYIEAPNVSDEELAVFVNRIQKECPVAAQMGDIIYKRK
uniref:OsmC-like protein n=1 Tax=Paramoeba aestuarina TaxID=180227 RepID=A0A7S4UML8_9EUKA|mmetsp:Transcript_40159/g.63524  ORF Transcript_40159/g.63524 Transcript_40159/m.63524 type:complete len:172 (+) Transcript_40159:172-687(+)